MGQVPELDIKYTDIPKGETHRHRISYGLLTSNLKAKIDAVDLTVRELLELAVIELRIGNLYEMELSDRYFTTEDVEWP